MKYRPHRASLADSMANVIEFKDRAELIAHLKCELGHWGYDVTDSDVVVKFYVTDVRIGWDTHLVCVRNKLIRPDMWFFPSMEPEYYGAIGFTDGPC